MEVENLVAWNTKLLIFFKCYGYQKNNVPFHLLHIVFSLVLIFLLVFIRKNKVTFRSLKSKEMST